MVVKAGEGKTDGGNERGRIIVNMDLGEALKIPGLDGKGHRIRGVRGAFDIIHECE